jgi:hypothetical protein
MKKHFYYLTALTVALVSCKNSSTSTDKNALLQQQAQSYLNSYNAEYQRLSIVANEASWKSNTYIVEGDTATKNATNRSSEAIAVFTGSNSNIDSAKKIPGCKRTVNRNSGEAISVYFV